MRSSTEISAGARLLDDCRRAVVARLAAVRRRIRRHLLLEGLAWAAGTAAVLALVSLLFDRTVRPELTARLACVALGALLLFGVAFRRLGRPLSLSLNDLDLVELLERRSPGVGQRLTNVLQLPDLLVADPSASPSMIGAAVRQDADEIARTNLEQHLNISRCRKVVLGLALLAGLVTAFCVAAPATAGLWARRWFSGSTVRWPQRTYLALVGLGEDDRWLVPRGETAILTVSSRPEMTQIPEGWRVAGRGWPLVVEGATAPQSQTPDDVSIEFRLADGSQRRGTFVKFADDEFRYELPPLDGPASVTITGGDDWFGPITIEPVDRPAVEELTLIAHAPGKSEPERIRAGDAQSELLFLPTTKLELELVSTQPLTSATAVSQGTVAAPPLERVDDRHYRTAWQMQEPLTLEFQLVGERGGLNSKPHFLSVGVLQDRPPRVTIRSSGVGRRVTPVARIPLHVRAVDDFGVAELAVELELTRIEESQPKVEVVRPVEEKLTAAAPARLPADVEREPRIALADHALPPGSMVRLRCTAVDNCVLGARSGESRWLSFQVVSPEELFYEILTRQREQRAKFTKTLEGAKAQLTALGSLNTPAERAGLSRVHQVTARQVWQIAGQLDATLQEMTLNDVGSAPARTLLDENIIRPLRALHDQTLADVRSKLDRLMSTPEIDEARREEAVQAQTVAVETMQKILDQMSQWESFVDVVNQLRHIIKSQALLRESTEKTEKTRINDLFDE